MIKYHAETLVYLPAWLVVNDVGSDSILPFDVVALTVTL